MESNPESTYIEICGNKCVADSSASSFTEVFCYVPPLMTEYSVATYSLGAESALTGTIISSNTDEDEQAKLIDGNQIITYDDETIGCFTGIQLKEEYVGVLAEAKFFIGSVGDYAPYANKVTL